MLKISTKEDCIKISRLSPQVQGEVEDIIARLNFYYGEHRNTETDMGGYVLVLEEESDYERVEKIFNQPIHLLIPEHVKKIAIPNGNYTSSLLLCNDDFAITIIAAMELTPPSFLEYVKIEVYYK